MHPMQEIVKDEDGVVRFRPNKIVRFLLDWATPRGMDMNAIAIMQFDAEDREQFAQLIGYSVCGYGDLRYVSDESYEKAAKVAAELAD